MLFAPNRFVMDWVNEKYLRRIEEVLKDLNGGQAPRVNMKVGSAPREDEPVKRSEAPALLMDRSTMKLAAGLRKKRRVWLPP